MVPESELKEGIIRLVRQYSRAVHQQPPFVPGETYVPYGGRCFDEDELVSLIDASLEFWLTAGRFTRAFERGFASFFGTEHCILTNSGSSANLLAMSALTSPKLGERRLKPGDEVLTVAAAFPTTVNPIVQNRLVPVFVDVDVGTYNIRADLIEDALSERTKAICLAHTLGNPFDLTSVMDVADAHDLWVIEDNCDAVGSTFGERYTGTVGHIGTFSFFPAHHITMGEGGALITDDTHLKRIITSFRDWGRDCWCEPGSDDTCGQRFNQQFGSLPPGYDHKYVYSHIGYNLKATDLQAAIGVEQLKKLPSFIEARRRNFTQAYDGLRSYEDALILPRAEAGAEPSWFGFPLTVREGADFTRNELTAHLEEKKIATRNLFAGNIIRHPSFKDVVYRIHGELTNTDRIMNDTFWFGVYPGLGEEHIRYIVDTLGAFINGNS